MLSGFYTLGSGLLTEQRKLDVIGNNLANLQTPGYRADGVTISDFEKQLLARTTAAGQKSFGKGAPTAVVGKVYQYQDAGVIHSTGRKLDVALDGEGYFKIQSTDGTNQTYLTRDGNFDRDENGYLVLPGYGYVLDASGQRIQLDSADFTLGEHGTIYNSDGDEVATLAVAMPSGGASGLVKQDNGMFTLANGATAATASGYRTVQGSLELSNVNTNQEMTRLIETQRAYQLNSSALKIVDQLNQKAASQIASV